MKRSLLARAGAVVIAAGLGVVGSGAAPGAGGEHCLEAARPGPPLICHPIVIGDAKSLPLGDEPLEPKKGYRASGVVKDTLAILKTERSTLVRMETLRRATIYVSKDKSLATELLAKVSWKAMDTDASGTPSAAAWFDAAYLAGCYSQMDVDIDWNAGVSNSIIGYAWMKHALVLDGNDAEMQFGAALMTLPAMHRQAKAQYDEHVRRAAMAAEKGSLLEVNLAAHLSNWGTSIEKVRASAGNSGAAVGSNKATDDPRGT